jgi:hypothetical protein
MASLITGTWALVISHDVAVDERYAGAQRVVTRHWKGGLPIARSTAARDSEAMGINEEVLWSPARRPYAIAVSHSWWALRSATLFAADAKKSEGHAQQIYARQLFGHLRVLRRCAEMMAT